MLLSIDLETFNAMKAEKIRSKTRRIVAELNLAAEKWAEKDLMKSYSREERKADTMFSILGIKKEQPPLVDYRTVAREEAFEYYFQANRTILPTVSRFLSLYMLASRQTKAQVQMFDFTELAADIELLAQDAIAEGLAIGKVKKQVLSYLQVYIDEDKFIEINGKFYKANKYAEMVARTETSKITTKVTLEKSKEYHSDLVEVSSHEVEEGDDECEEHDGQIYSISGSSDKYDQLDAVPPYHPNCQHFLMPTSEEAIAVRRE